MFLVIGKRQLLLAGVCCLLCLFGLRFWMLDRGEAAETFAASSTGCTIIVDPGHGGEDGGAVAADGTVESGLNLEIALRIHDLLRFCGQDSIMTRQEDISIYSDGAKTLRQKKASDLKNRVALVNETPNSILLSIHQNTLPSSPSVHGAQVFYNRSDGSPVLAKSVQDALNTTINPDGGKTEKQIADTIYLMKHVTAPAVLVECGFLSNPDETKRLLDSGYQTQLATAITAGLLSGLTADPVDLPNSAGE